MSKNVPAGLQTILNTKTTHLATIVKIAPETGDPFFYTSHDRDIVYMGDTYRADIGLTVSAIAQATGTGASDFTMEILASDDAITTDMVRDGILDNARVTVYTIDYENISEGVVTMFVGRWADSNYRELPYIKCNVRSLLSQDKYLTTQVYSTTCRADLGDDRCKVDLDALKHSGTITSVFSRQSFRDTSISDATNFWNGGTIVFTSGANDGVAQEIKSSSSSGILTIQLLLPRDVEIGDTFDLYPGCNKQLGYKDTIGDCINKYDNAVNFRGEPQWDFQRPSVGLPITNVIKFGATNGNKTGVVQLFKYGNGTTVNDIGLDDSNTIYGKPIPLVFGSSKVSGMTIWTGQVKNSYVQKATDIITQAVGGAKTEQVLTKSVGDFAVAFAYPGITDDDVDPTTDIVRLWCNGALVFDKSNPTGIVSLRGVNIQIMPGRETQPPHPLIEADVGVDKTPAYRGLIWAMFKNFDFLPYNGEIPIIEAEVSVSSVGKIPLKVFGTPLDPPDPIWGIPLNDTIVLDSLRQRVYSFHFAGVDPPLNGRAGFVRIWSTVTQEEIDWYEVPSDADTQYRFNDCIGYSQKNQLFAVSVGEVQNGMPLALVSAKDGQEISRFGDFSNSITPSETNVSLMSDMFFEAGIQYNIVSVPGWAKPGANGIHVLPTGNNITVPNSVAKPTDEILFGTDIFKRIIAWQLPAATLTLKYLGHTTSNGTDLYSGGVRWFNKGPIEYLRSAAYLANTDYAANAPNSQGLVGRMPIPVKDCICCFNDAGVEYFGTFLVSPGMMIDGAQNKKYEVGNTFLTGTPTNQAIPLELRVSGHSVTANSWKRKAGLQKHWTIPTGWHGIWCGMVDTGYVCMIIEDAGNNQKLQLFAWHYTAKVFQDDAGTSHICFPWAASGRVEDQEGNFTLVKEVNLTAPVYFNDNIGGIRTSNGGNGYIAFPGLGANTPIVYIDPLTLDFFYVETDGVSYEDFDDPDINYGELTLNSGQVQDPQTQSVYVSRYEQVSDGEPGYTPIEVGTLVRAYPGRATGNGITIANLLRGYCVTAGYDTGDIETTGLNERIRGSIINVKVALKDLLGNVCGLFLVDIIESEGKIKFKRQESGSVVDYDIELTRADLMPLARDQSGGDNQLLEISRDGTNAMPAELAVKFLDAGVDYRVSTLSATRPKFPVLTTSTQTVITLSVPVAMTAAEALFWATRALYSFWASNTTKRFLLPSNFMGIDPSDFVSLIINGQYQGMRVESITYNADRSISVQARNIREDNDTPYPEVGDQPNPGTIPQPSWAEPIFIQNIVNAQYNRYKEGYDVTGADGWNLTDYQTGRSDPLKNAPLNYFTYSNVFFTADTFPSTAASSYSVLIEAADGTVATGSIGGPPTYGVCVNSLPNTRGDRFAMDSTTELVVRVRNGEFTSADDFDAFTRGQNIAAVGRNGAWEIVYFNTVTDNGDGTVTISGFMRSQFSTEFNVEKRRNGDIFMVFDPTEPGVQIPMSMQGQSALVYIFDASMDQSDATPFPITINYDDRRAPAFGNIRASLSGTDIHIRADWRSMWEVPSLPNSVTPKYFPHGAFGYHFKVAIINAAGEIIRELGTQQDMGGGGIFTGFSIKGNYSNITNFTAPSPVDVTYSAAQQTADGYTPGAVPSIIVRMIKVDVASNYPQEYADALAKAIPGLVQPIIPTKTYDLIDGYYEDVTCYVY